ncbi:hypothetical protein GOFOIKOB_4405 [Methylobacterium tardum]|uniref:Uncharacterized protein n=1 Tax=Methylobacterium tardum TaxID=374432 RepID=A0AA37WR42_9HYPH|nr:hypothetical protein [Methylobacterium tardum]URD35345.1 hypothetical protein M6G65_22880 [Methylobacterium tardum]GJE51348.1 hypothetical protein GOFOIKOB_4405 [Methylobacterium tardum]GLS68667.1 hypothetical protein GCM10007890_06790 [Methylobacterium tardum]
MPLHDTTALSGTIRHVFAHRFTIEADGQTHLADLGPKGADAFALASGLHVTLQGERRPSEIKVTRISAAGRDPVEIQHKKPHHAPGPKRADTRSDGPADPAHALAAAAAAGWTVVEAPRHKPRHFELLARRGEAAATELHVDFCGTIYKEKPAAPAKWATLA